MAFYLQKAGYYFALAAAVQILSACGPGGPRAEERDDQEGWIGVYVQDIDPEMQRYLNLKSPNGVLVSEVVEGGPADRAGLRAEDVIIAFDGKRVRDSERLIKAVRKRRPRDRVKIEIVRDGEKDEKKLRIGARPAQDLTGHERRHGRDFARAFRWHDRDRAWLGIEMADLNQDLAEYFDLDEGEGVLVLTIVEDSPAEEAGLKAGDIITEIDGEQIREKNDLVEVLSEKQSGDEIEVRVVRKRKTKNIEVTLAATKRNRDFHFDRDDTRELRNGFRSGLREWQRDLKNWKNDLKEWARDAEDHGRIKIEFQLEDLARDLERGLESLDENLEMELENFADELEDLDIRVRVRKPFSEI